MALLPVAAYAAMASILAMPSIGLAGASLEVRSSDNYAMYLPSASASKNISDVFLPVLVSATDPTLADLRRKAIEGDPSAQYALGERFEKGFGVKQDYEQALNWYTLSAKNNYVLAQWSLAYMYFEGRGTPKDLRSALMWSEKAAAMGDQSSARLAAEIRAELNKPMVDRTRARLRIAILNSLNLLDQWPGTIATSVPSLALLYDDEPTRIEPLKRCPASRATYAVSDQSQLRLYIIDNPFPDRDVYSRNIAFVIKGDELANFFSLEGSNSTGAVYLQRFADTELIDKDDEELNDADRFQVFFFDSQMQQMEDLSSEETAPSAIFVSETSRSFLFDGKASEYIPAQFWFLVACRPDLGGKSKSSGASPLD